MGFLRIHLQQFPTLHQHQLRILCLSPISLTLTSTTGSTQHVSGLPSNGLKTICSNLIAQNALDSAGWDHLIITSNGTNLRTLSPSNRIVFNPSLFQDYWTPYIDAVWSQYISTPLTVDTQTSWGSFTAYTSNDRSSLIFANLGPFTKPSACDVFGANSGAFAPQASSTAQLLNLGLVSTRHSIAARYCRAPISPTTR